MPDLDKMFEKLPPQNLGKLLFRETYKDEATKDLQQKSPVKGEHLGKLEKAAALLQANIKKTDSDLPELEAGQKQQAAENMRDNLSFKQMSKVAATVEAYENYSQKNWLSKALTKFVDGICRRFSQLKTQGVGAGVKDIMEKGAGVKIGTQDEKKVNIVAKKGTEGQQR